jgi:hypothetical protein
MTAMAPRSLVDELEIARTNTRILQEVSCAEDWNEVQDILHRHREHYYALQPQARQELNEQIRDLMDERR